MAKQNIYGLGTTTEIMLSVYDNDGNEVVPTESRLSIEDPDGIVITVSGGDMTSYPDYLSYLYMPTVSGWYHYEAWVRDSDGRQSTKYHGFHVVDHIE